MPAPIIMQGQSGIDIPNVISKLIEAERTPLKRLEEDNKRNEIRIQAWEELRTKAKKLSDVSRDIYSFTGPFANRKLFSSDDAITGTVSPNIEELNQKIQVLQLAKNHKIHTREIQKDEIFPPAKFSIIIDKQLVEFDFKGGDITSFEKLLREKSGNIFDVSSVNIRPNVIILSIASKISGSKGRLQFKDPDNLLKSLELIGEKGEKQEKEEILEYNISDFNDSNNVVLEKNTFSFAKLDKLEYNVPINDNIQQIDFQFQYDIQEKKEVKKEKERLYIGPEIKNKIGDIELLGPQIERERITENNIETTNYNEQIGKLILHYQSSGTNKTYEIPLQQNKKSYSVSFRELEGSEAINKIQRIEFIKNFDGIFKTKEIKIKKIVEGETLFGPMHEIDPPQDAKLLVNGVEVSRSSNNDLTDIIPGVSLNLHKTTSHEIELKVQYDFSKIKEKIKDWVNAYNDLMLFVKQNDKFNRDQDFELNRSSNPNERIEDGFRKLEDSSGIFAGDPVARRIVSLLTNITGNAYPTKLKPSFRTLAQIGISTGKPGSTWQDIKQGLLSIDETVLDDALMQYPDSVKELFALDKNEDAIIDDGIGFKMNQELDPYVKFAGGIITSRIDLLKEQIKQNKKIIYNKELSLGRKEEMLRKKFGNMETNIQNTRNMGKFLQNKLGIKEE